MNGYRPEYAIYKKDANEIYAKVITVGYDEIEYKKWENIDGPTYIISSRDVFTIKYQNGVTETINSYNTKKTNPKPKIKSQPKTKTHTAKYQGEFAFGYGLGIGKLSKECNMDRLELEMVHGIRVNPYFYTGIGFGYLCFYDKKPGEYYYAHVLTPYLNLKGYCPFNKIVSIYLSADLGVAKGVGGYISGREFYTAIGPGISFGKKTKCDLSIRYQHLGHGLIENERIGEGQLAEGVELKALLVRVGFTF